jgi:arabinose-5-phosphate isomerase
MHVSDFMMSESMPTVNEDDVMAAVIAVMDRAGIGVALVVKPDRTVSGIITDGDIRRLLARGKDLFAMSARQVMTPKPKTVRQTLPAYDALNLMEAFEITVLPVVDINGVVLGVLHLHDILGKGSFKFNGM